MAERNKLASIPGQPLPERQSNFLSDLWDEASGAFARYGRRSAAQRDASLALLNQAVDPNTDPLSGAAQKVLGLAGLVTHPLAFFPTREEWDQRLQAAGNDSRIGRSIGGFLSDLPSLIDPQMAAGGAALAAAPIVGKLGRGIGDLAGDATDAELAALRARLQAEAAQTGGTANAASEVVSSAQPGNLFKWRDELWSGVKEGRTFKDEPALWRAMSKDEFDALMNDGVLKPRPGAEGAIYVTDDADRVATPGGSYGAKANGGVIVRIKKSDTVPLTSRNVRGLAEIGVPQISKDDVTGVWDAKSGDLIDPQRKQFVTQSYKETLPDGTTRWVPGTLRANPTTGPRFEPDMSIADIRRYIEQFGEPPPPRAKGEIVTGKRKDVYPDGTVTPVPGLLRTKRPNNK